MNKPTRKQYEAALLIVEAFDAKPAKAKKAKKAPKKFVREMRARRQVRFETTTLGGLTRGQRQALARKLEAKHGEYTRAQWEKAVAKVKANGFA